MLRNGRRRPADLRSIYRKLLDYLLAGALLFLLILLVVRLQDSQSPPASGVAIVNDGDSITLAGTRIRLRHIDAPEYMQTCRRDNQPYACGREARLSLQQLIGKRTVVCENHGTDRYGRMLGQCRAGEINLNAAQVRAGWAVSFGGYEQEEAEASRAGLGLWAGEFQQPREWRSRHGHAVEPSHDPLAGIGDRIRSWLSWLTSGR